MNIFIVSNSSFTETVAILSLKYLTQIHIDKMIVLRENHDEMERVILADQIVRICNNIEEAVQLCDIAILYSDTEFSDKRRQKIIDLCNNYNRVFHIVELPHDLIGTKQKQMATDQNIQIPLLVSVAVGRYHYQCRTEFIIQSVLKQLGVSNRHYFSHLGEHLLKQYSFLLDKHYFDGKDDTGNSCQIEAVSFTYPTFNELLLDDCLYRKMVSGNPLVVVVDIDASFNLLGELGELFKYKFGHEIDLLLRSDYAQLSINSKGATRPIYFASEVDTISKNPFIQYPDIFMNIYHTIVSKIAFPQGVKYKNTL